MSLKPTIFALLFLICVGAFSSCGEKFYVIEDTKWAVQFFWDSGPQATSEVEFFSNNTLTMVDDTATYSGTWTRNEQAISWTVEVPNRRLDCASTVDKDHIEGTLIDEQGLTGLVVGGKL